MDIQKLRDLEKQGYLKSEKHEKYDLLLWKYTNHCQYEQYWTKETIACRSLVTDLEGEIVSTCLPKFFNIEEQKHVSSYRFKVTEKLDGQLVYLFWYNYDELPIIRSSGSFTSDVVSNVYKLLENVNLDELPRDITYCFELTGKIAKIVVDYPYEAKLTLLTAFTNFNHKEIHNLTSTTFPIVDSYNVENYKDLKELNLDNKEGFVVKFSSGDRCKIKFQNYIDKHYFRFALSTTLIWEHLKNNTIENFIDDLPDESFNLVNKEIVRIQLQVESIRRKIDFNCRILRTIQFERKELFEFVNKLSYPLLTLAQYDGKSITNEIYKLIKPEFKLLQ